MRIGSDAMTWLLWMWFKILICEFLEKIFSLSDWFILVESRETGSGASDMRFKKRNKHFFPLSVIPCACASQTTGQTSHLHVFVLVSLCNLAMRNKGVRWRSNIQCRRTCAQVRTESFPRTLNYPPLTDRLPTFPPTGTSIRTWSRIAKPLTDVLIAFAIHPPLDSWRSASLRSH